MQVRSSALSLFWFALILPALGLGGCDWPRDARGSLAEVISTRMLKVGILEQPPWAIYQDGEPAGVEVEMVKRLCGELGCTPRWFRGSPDELMPALETFELHLVIGSIRDDTPWHERIGLTRPFLQSDLLVAFPHDRPAIPSVRGHRIAAPPGSHAAGLIRQRGGTPVEPDAPDSTGLPIAVENWELDRRNLKESGLVLETLRRVWAIPPGENAWLYRLDHFLDRQAPMARKLLAGGSPP